MSLLLVLAASSPTSLLPQAPIVAAYPLGRLGLRRPTKLRYQWYSSDGPRHDRNRRGLYIEQPDLLDQRLQGYGILLITVHVAKTAPVLLSTRSRGLTDQTSRVRDEGWEVGMERHAVIVGIGAKRRSRGEKKVEME